MFKWTWFLQNRFILHESFPGMNLFMLNIMNSYIFLIFTSLMIKFWNVFDFLNFFGNLFSTFI